MVVMQLSSDNRDRLEAQGFEIAELKGFDAHNLPLYTHREVSDKKPGDVVLHARVGNPGSLDDGEATYLARKAFHGFFPWLPGDDCMARQFQDISIPKSGAREAQQSEPAMGCKWCRERAADSTADPKFGTAKKAMSDAPPKSARKPRASQSKSKADRATAKAPVIEDTSAQPD